MHRVDHIFHGDGVCVYFECSDLDQGVAALVTLGIVFEELLEDKPWLWRVARLRDLDGNQIILFYGGKHSKHPPWRL